MSLLLERCGTAAGQPEPGRARLAGRLHRPDLLLRRRPRPTDPEGGALTYDWNWGDGTAHGTTATPSHTFTSGGDKTVTLTVTDPQGATGTDTVTATPTDPPANAAPTARITGVSCTNLSCSFDGSTSSDPDSDTLTYSWNFGDSTARGTTANPTHTVHDRGVEDRDADRERRPRPHRHRHDDGQPVGRAEPAPTAHITDVSCPSLTCSFSGATSTDPENDTLTYSWNFGDGTAPARARPRRTPTPTAGRRSTVTLTVNDGHGHTATDTATANPTARNPASNITFVGSTSRRPATARPTR